MDQTEMDTLVKEIIGESKSIVKPWFQALSPQALN